MTIFYVIIGVSVVGIGLVFFLLKKEKEESESTVEKLPPEALKEGPFSTAEEIKPAKKKGSLFGKLKLGKKKQVDGFEEPAASFPKDEESPKAGFAKKLGFGKILAKFSKKDKGSGPFEAPDFPEEKKSPLKKIFGKLKFGKKNDDDDIPQATSFPSLKDKLSNFSKQKDFSNLKNDNPLPLLKDIDTGTAALHTTKEPEKNTLKPLSAPKPHLSDVEQKKIEQEVESATELAEMSNKYEKMEKLLNEKNEELDKVKGTFDSEIGHRKDFNKIKDLLEHELKEVKDRVKQSKAEMATLKTENENYQKRIRQLEEKATKLEKEILAKEEENEALRKKSGAPASGAAKVPIQPSTPIETPKAVDHKEPAASQDVPAPKPVNPPSASAAPTHQKTAPVMPNKEVAPKKPSADDISKFEESLGIMTGKPKPAPASDTAKPKEPEVKPILQPPSVTAPQAPKTAEPPKPPEATAPKPPSVPAPKPPEAPAPSMPMTPDNPSDEGADDNEPGETGFLRLSPDPLADQKKDEQNKDKKE